MSGVEVMGGMGVIIRKVGYPTLLTLLTIDKERGAQIVLLSLFFLYQSVYALLGSCLYLKMTAKSSATTSA